MRLNCDRNQGASNVEVHHKEKASGGEDQGIFSDNGLSKRRFDRARGRREDVAG